MYDEMTFLQLFGNDAFISVNKHLAKEIGLVEACLFGEILSKYKYFKSQDQLVDNKWFYLTVDTVEENIGLKKDWQETAIKNLVKFGLIEKKRMGLPAKRYFSVNVSKLMDIYLKKTDEPLMQSDRGETSNKKEVKPQTRKSSNLQQEEGETSIIKRSNKNDLEKELNKKNPNPLSHNREIINLSLPMPLRKFLFENRDKVNDMNLNLDELEEFYNTDSYINPNADRDDLEHLNSFEFTQMVKSIVINVYKIENSTNGLLKKYILNRLSFKKENLVYNYDDHQEVDFFNNPIADKILNKN